MVRKMIDRWIAEATECDFKVALEVKKPKSWLKSVSAFANGIGGTLFFGIDDGRNVIGLSDAQTDAEMISRLIKERITPYPSFVLAPERENGKDILVLSVSAGRSTPYYYKADGIMEAYIRMGNESVIAPSYVLNQLILKGMHRTYDELISEYDFKDYAFSKLRERYKAWTGNSMEEKLFDSFDMRDENGKLTNAGALLADDTEENYFLNENEEFLLSAAEKYGAKGAKQAQALVDEVRGLFAGGNIADEDLDVMMKALQDAYWIAKEKNKKFTPKKYRKD